MLKDKSILEKFDLVEELEDKIAERVNGVIENETDGRLSVFWLRIRSGESGILSIRAGDTATVDKSGLNLVYDGDPIRGSWKPVLAEGIYDREDRLSLVIDADDPNKVVALVSTLAIAEV